MDNRMSTSLKAAEITVRVFILVLQLCAVIGGGLWLGLFPSFTSTVNTTGGLAIVISALVFIYEFIMIIFVVVPLEFVNHSARLLVDCIVKSILTGVTFIVTLIVIIIGVILIAILSSLTSYAAGIVVAVFAVPVGIGVIFLLMYLVSAISFAIIRSKLKVEPVAPQPVPPMILTAPATFITVPAVGQSNYPPGYTSNFLIPMTSGTGEYQTEHAPAAAGAVEQDSQMIKTAIV